MTSTKICDNTFKTLNFVSTNNSCFLSILIFIIIVTVTGIVTVRKRNKNQKLL